MKNLLILTILLALLGLFPLAAQAEPVGKFTSIEGRVDITSPGEAARTAYTGDELSVGDIIRAKSKSKAEITFVDGSILRVAQKTRVEIDEYMVEEGRTTGMFNLFRGKIQNVVKKTGGFFGFKEKNKYEVHTPTAVCGVRGTNYFSSFQRGTSNFIFKEGQGYGYSKNQPDQMTIINAGQAMMVRSADLPPVVRAATVAEIERHMADTVVNDEGERGEEERDDRVDHGDAVEDRHGGEVSDDDATDERADDSPRDEGPGEDRPGDDRRGDDRRGDQGPRDDRRGDDRRGGPGPGDQAPGDYGPRDYGPGGPPPGDYGPGGPYPGGEPGPYGGPGPYYGGEPGPYPGPDPYYGGEPGPYPGPDPYYGGDPYYAGDPYMGDPYYDPYFDPYYDPYFDPYIPPDSDKWYDNKPAPAFSVDSIGISGDPVGGKYPLTMSGKYYQSPPFMYMNENIYGRLSQGSGDLSQAYFYGYTACAWNYYPAEVDGIATFFYVHDDTSGGFLLGDISGSYDSANYTWSASGYADSIQMTGSGIQYDYPNMYARDFRFVTGTDSGSFGGGGSIYVDIDHPHGIWDCINGQDWGIWNSGMHGTYSGSTSSDWFLEWHEKGFVLPPYPYEENLYLYMAADGFVWSGYEETEGDVMGGWVDIEQATTGILAGELHGGYNPNNQDWFAGAAGVWMETSDFLAMVGSSPGDLDKLNIPRYTIGQSSLTGDGNNMHVEMNNVYFLSDTSEATDPRIWATNDVSGTYSALPVLDQAVTLAGPGANGLSVEFTPNKWDSGKWGASVSGGGTYTGGGTMTGTISMGGGAAGTYDSGDFSGTGAGWATK